LLERLAALTPRPRINLVLYYGVLAAHAAWRSRLPRDGLAVARPRPPAPRRVPRDGRHAAAAGRGAGPRGAPAVESALGAAHGPEFRYQAADGAVHTVPRAWTSLASPDAFEVVAAGRASFRPEDLLGLAVLLDEIQHRHHDEKTSHGL
jgi:hypothetical protein